MASATMSNLKNVKGHLIDMFLLLYLFIFSIFLISYTIFLTEEGNDVSLSQGILVVFLVIGILFAFPHLKRLAKDHKQKEMLNITLYVGILAFVFYGLNYLQVRGHKTYSEASLIWFFMWVPPRYLFTAYKLEANKKYYRDILVTGWLSLFDFFTSFLTLNFAILFLRATFIVSWHLLLFRSVIVLMLESKLLKRMSLRKRI